MKAARGWALAGSLGLVLSSVALTAGAAAATTPHRVTLRGSVVPARELAHPDGTVAGTSSVRFDMVLALRNASGARAFSQAVSTPGSALFHHYLSDAAWVSRFGPSRDEVSRT